MNDKKNCKSCEKLDSFLEVENLSNEYNDIDMDLNRHHNDVEVKSKFDNLHSKNENNNSNEKEHKHKQEEDFKFWKLVVGLVSLAIVFWTFWAPFNFGKNDWFQFSLATISMLTIGYEFWKETIKDAINKKLSVEILVTISSSFAYVFSTIFLILKQTNVFEPNYLFFEAVVEILTIIYFGRFLENVVTKKAINEIDVIKELIPVNAILFKDNKEILINANKLKINDIVIVKKGQMIPSDGVIIEGESVVLETSFTGEVNNNTKKVGDFVLGGTISSTNIIKVKIQKELKHSFVSKIIEGLSKTNEFKPKTQKIADFVASILIPFVLISSIVALILWGTLGNSSDSWFVAINVMITVMVIACPCSLGLTTPTSILVGSSVATKMGIFFNSKNVFESFKNVDAVVFDKTGTLTEGVLNIVDTNLNDFYLKLIKEVESNFAHPISKSLYKNISSNFILEDKIIFEEHQSLGVQFLYQNQNYFFGSLKFVKQFHDNYELDEKQIEKLKNGSQILFLFNLEKIIGFIELSDPIKETSLEAIQNLQEMNIEVYVLTGDNKNTSNYVASMLNIPSKNVFSEVDPLEKQQKIQELQKQTKSVIFVGDGNNDAVAMKQANLSISMNSGTDVAVKMSDVTILDNDLRKISEVIYLSNKTLFNIYRGFSLSILYNVIAIPLALSGILNPLIGAIMMMFSDTLAIFNSLTLRLILYKKDYKKYRKKNK